MWLTMSGTLQVPPAQRALSASTKPSCGAAAGAELDAVAGSGASPSLGPKQSRPPPSFADKQTAAALSNRTNDSVVQRPMLSIDEACKFLGSVHEAHAAVAQALPVSLVRLLHTKCRASVMVG